MLLLLLIFNVLCTVNSYKNEMSGKVVIVTGGNSGIGFETSKDLARRGAKVILSCRDHTRCNEAKEKIIKSTKNQDVHYRILDLAAFESIRAFVKNITETESRLDVLINNAGAIALGNKKTVDGLLVGMQTNYFGPFLLTYLLLPFLKSSAPSRIINVSSALHVLGQIDFENLNMEKETDETYSDFRVYANSKLCEVLMTLEMSRQLKGTNVTVNSADPGAVKTDIIKNLENPLYKRGLQFLMDNFYKSAREGAATSIYLAVSPNVENVTGGYFQGQKDVTSSKLGQDVKLARKLWKVSKRLVNVK